MRQPVFCEASLKEKTGISAADHHLTSTHKIFTRKPVLAYYMPRTGMTNNLQTLVTELNELDTEMVMIDGVMLKPSQCYHFGTDPVHLLFNTNCPDILKEKVNAIIARHLPEYEGRTPE